MKTHPLPLLSRPRFATRAGTLGKTIMATVLCAVAFSAFAGPATSPIPVAGDAGAPARQQPDSLTMREAFRRLPLEIVDMLTQSTRLDMMDYLDADSLWHAANTLGGESWIESATPDLMTVRLTPVSKLQMAFLPRLKASDPQLLAVAYTIGSRSDLDPEAADTQLWFFDSSMKPLEVKRFFTQPRLKDFFSFPKGAKTTMREMEEAIPFPSYSFTFATPSELEGELTISPVLALEDRKLVDMFRVSRRWRWNGRRFELVKLPK